MYFENLLLERCREIINTWTEKDIYAISFMLYPNANENVGGFGNFPEFSVGYNTESYCEYAPKLSEERWNYAFWLQNNTTIISSQDKTISQNLIEWYRENKIGNLGVISDDEYDADMKYIGKGPGGYYELLMLISEIAKKLQSDGTIKGKFGNIPVIVHDLEYAWYSKIATAKANPNGEADEFIATYEQFFE